MYNYNSPSLYTKYGKEVGGRMEDRKGWRIIILHLFTPGAGKGKRDNGGKKRM